jgi:hypothetical protein
MPTLFHGAAVRCRLAYLRWRQQLKSLVRGEQRPPVCCSHVVVLLEVLIEPLDGAVMLAALAA